MTDRLERLLEDTIEALNTHASELRKLRAAGVVARLSEADRNELAQQVFERVDERMAPLDDNQAEGAPRPRPRSGYFKR